jgi:hypothetical protein
MREVLPEAMEVWQRSPSKRHFDDDVYMHHTEVLGRLPRDNHPLVYGYIFKARNAARVWEDTYRFYVYSENLVYPTVMPSRPTSMCLGEIMQRMHAYKKLMLRGRVLLPV